MTIVKVIPYFHQLWALTHCATSYINENRKRACAPEISNQIPERRQHRDTDRQTGKTGMGMEDGKEQ